jgi:Rieske Fe-S protein
VSEQSLVNRRHVLAGAGIAAVGVAVAACAPGSSDEANPDIQGTSVGASGTVLAAIADVPIGGGVIISDPPIVVTQPKSGDIKGFTAICPHAGCLVSTVENDEIICPCHGSRFSAVDGSVIQGPADQPLEPADVNVKGTNVILA